MRSGFMDSANHCEWVSTITVIVLGVTWCSCCGTEPSAQLADVGSFGA